MTVTGKNRLFEARKFARLYNDKQLETLCSLGKKQGRPLTIFHVRQLIRVPKRQHRNALAKRCAKECWSVQRLELEVGRFGPRRKYGGRRHEPPRTEVEALLVSEKMARSWIRWVEVLKGSPKDVVAGTVTLKSLPKIQKKLDAISGQSKELCKLIEKRLATQYKVVSKKQ